MTEQERKNIKRRIDIQKNVLEQKTDIARDFNSELVRITIDDAIEISRLLGMYRESV